MFYLSYREYGLSKMVSSHLFYRVRWIIPERLGKLRVQKGEPCMKLDKQTYQQLLERKSPNSPLWRDCLLAFLIGGAICTVGEGVRQLWLSRGLDTEDTAAATAITMVFLGALLTCLHLYEKLAKYAGAGTIVPDHRLCKCHCFSGDGVQKRGAYPRSGRKAVCYRGTGAGIRHFGKRHLRSHSVFDGRRFGMIKRIGQAHACARKPAVSARTRGGSRQKRGRRPAR